METSLSNNGYKVRKTDLTMKELKEIKDELNVKPYTYNKVSSRFPIFLESPKKLYLPRFYGVEHFGKPTEYKISEGDDIDITFNGDLRDEQKPIEELYIAAAEEKGGGIISIRCGGGKTVLALHIAYLLKKKVIVLVHKDFLMTQWRDRILQFLPDAKIGKVQQNTIDIEGKDIVLAMVQSLSMKEYPPDTFESFGLAIFDECHHLGAEVFYKSMTKVASKYMLGLSATPKRKDGLAKVFKWFIGDIVYSQKEKNEDYVEVQLIDIPFEDREYNKIEMTFRREPCGPRMINNVCNYLPRTQMIVDLLLKYNVEGRTTLVLSDRREHLNTLYKMLDGYSRGFYVGGMKPQELRESQSKSILLATFSMASEGMDIPELDTVILASPKSDVEQSVGRIFRKKACDRTFHPLIIDMQDTFSMFGNQSKKRVVFYKANNFTIFRNGVKFFTPLMNGEEVVKKKGEKKERKKKKEVVKKAKKKEVVEKAVQEFALID